MDQSPRTARLFTVPRILFLLVAAAAFVCGYRGLSLYVQAPPAGTNLGTRPLDLLYYDVQLFVLGSDPVSAGPPYNVWLDIGRFLAAATTVYGLTLAALKLFGASLRRWLNRMARDHVIVVGDTAEAAAIARHLETEPGPDGARRKVLTVVKGDDSSLESVGVKAARMLVACGDDSATNVTAARTAARLHHRGGFAVHVMINDPGLALVLRAQQIARSDQAEHPMFIFTMDELAARQHMRRASFDGVRRPSLLVVGASTFGRAIVVEFARRWLTQEPGAGKVPVTLVDDGAEAAIREILDGWPFVGRVCELSPLQMPLAPALLRITRAPYRSYFCDEDEEKAQRGAVTAAGRWQPGPHSVVVRLSRLSPRGDKAALFDDVGGALDVVTVPVSAAQEVAEMEETPLALAKSIHQRYLEDSMRRGARPGSTPYLVEWNELPEDARAANIAQARDFPRKLRMIGCTIAPRTSLADDFFYRDGEVEMLARAEHERWMGERMGSGWQYGEQRDDRRRIHPMLVSWEQMSRQARDIDRDMVRRVPLEYDPVLELEGLQILRLAPLSGQAPVPVVLDDVMTSDIAERLAQRIHDGYVAEALARGQAMGTAPALRQWSELTEDLRDANRAQARGIGRKLDLIGAFATRDEPDEPFVFTDSEVEMLARAEHDRWARERVDAGWTYGPRDDATKHHPLLVPWGLLSAEDQEKDRAPVRAIPETLRAAGLFIARRAPAASS